MAMRFIEIALDPNPDNPIVTPGAGFVDVLSATLDSLDNDSALAYADVQVQGNGPGRARVTVRISTGSLDVLGLAVADVAPGEMARLHLSAAAALSDGTANFAIAISVEGASVRLLGVDTGEKPYTKLTIFGGFENGA